MKVATVEAEFGVVFPEFGGDGPVIVEFDVGWDQATDEVFVGVRNFCPILGVTEEACELALEEISQVLLVRVIRGAPAGLLGSNDSGQVAKVVV